jgi:hypothetical protein
LQFCDGARHHRRDRWRIGMDRKAVMQRSHAELSHFGAIRRKLFRVIDSVQGVG